MKSCISALLIILIVSVLVSNCVTTPVEGPDKKKEAELLISQGLDQYLLGRYNESISLSERALALDPSSVQAWTNKAYAEIALKQYGNAIQSLDRALALDPAVPRLWNMRGEALMALQRYPEAIQSFDKALQYAPEYQAAKLNKENATMKLAG